MLFQRRLHLLSQSQPHLSPIHIPLLSSSLEVSRPSESRSPSRATTEPSATSTSMVDVGRKGNGLRQSNSPSAIEAIPHSPSSPYKAVQAARSLFVSEHHSTLTQPVKYLNLSPSYSPFRLDPTVTCQQSLEPPPLCHNPPLLSSLQNQKGQDSFCERWQNTVLATTPPQILLADPVSSVSREKGVWSSIKMNPPLSPKSQQPIWPETRYSGRLSTSFPFYSIPKDRATGIEASVLHSSSQAPMQFPSGPWQQKHPRHWDIDPPLETSTGYICLTQFKRERASLPAKILSEPTAKQHHHQDLESDCNSMLSYVNMGPADKGIEMKAGLSTTNQLPLHLLEVVATSPSCYASSLDKSNWEGLGEASVEMAAECALVPLIQELESGRSGTCSRSFSSELSLFY
ncbi:unnamed protein product [Protopolystoma xenopodis]|uniref:Uncharacterized protein n=1 Tax=Protopolystoma xenopodis TaxID=117903 RepID=A0A3S5A5Z8_9PLAT|nr:unnamed protein product [Protopolystoma xenopodis]